MSCESPWKWYLIQIQAAFAAIPSRVIGFGNLCCSCRKGMWHLASKNGIRWRWFSVIGAVASGLNQGILGSIASIEALEVYIRRCKRTVRYSTHSGCMTWWQTHWDMSYLTRFVGCKGKEAAVARSFAFVWLPWSSCIYSTHLCAEWLVWKMSDIQVTKRRYFGWNCISACKMMCISVYCVCIFQTLSMCICLILATFVQPTPYYHVYISSIGKGWMELVPLSCRHQVL